MLCSGKNLRQVDDDGGNVFALVVLCGNIPRLQGVPRTKNQPSSLANILVVKTESPDSRMLTS
eukprot:5520324-Pleurochrysis_carterae.AAC.3